MRNTPMSETFCRHDDVDVHTQGYKYFYLFHRMFNLFFMVFAKNLELGLCPLSCSKIHENVIEHTFITFLGLTRLYEKGTPWSPL
jgi:hypothetical protein